MRHAPQEASDVHVVDDDDRQGQEVTETHLQTDRWRMYRHYISIRVLYNII